MNILNYPIHELLYSYWWSRFRQEIQEGKTEPNHIDDRLDQLIKQHDPKKYPVIQLLPLAKEEA